MSVSGDGRALRDACCGSGPGTCVFAKALLAQSASCERSTRVLHGERLTIDCNSPVAKANCATLAALLRERSRFALKLPGAERPLLHQQAMRLQCAGLAAIRCHFAPDETDVQRLVTRAQQAFGGLMELPWQDIVTGMQAWQPRRRRGSSPGGAAT